MTTSLDRCGCGAAVSPPTVLCWTCAGERRTLPNAKPAEPPACLPGCRPAYSVRIMSGPIQGDQIDHWPNCPNAPKPAEPPACQESTIAVEYRLVGGKVVASEPQSEPPIADGVGVGVGVGIANLFMGHEAETAGKVLARAYLALKAERDALKAEVEEKHTMLLNSAGHVNRLDRENAALKGKAAALELELAASDASRKSSTHNLAVANEENAALKARVEEIERLKGREKVRAFAKLHDPTECHDYDCDRCHT